ncbi:MAG: glycosyltransferase [Actinomycetales bacterium]
MRVLVTAFPAIGHFHAFAPFALAARSAGHDVCVATAPDLVPWAITCGLPARPIGPLVRTMTAASDPAHPERLRTDVWPGAVIEDLLRLGQEWRPDVVVHEEGEYAAVLACAHLGIPCVTHSWATPARSPFERAEAVDRLTPLWRRHAAAAGLPEIEEVEPRTVGALYLDACPPPFQLGGLRGIDEVATVRGVAFDGPGTGRTPVWLIEMDRPAAYVTLGADPAYSSVEQLRLLSRAIAPLVGSVVVTTGPNEVEDLGVLPDNVRAATYLPQSKVLPYVDLVVSHGGAGGLLGSLMHARPHLVVPGRNQSQQDVASVTAGIGTGLRLAADQHDEASIQEAVSELLGDVRFELAASKIRSQIERLPSPEEAVEKALALAG